MTYILEELGIGRTPIREALQRLAAGLLLESLPGKGFVVRPLTLQNTRAAFAALNILELGAASLAVRQRTALLLKEMREAKSLKNASSIICQNSKKRSAKHQCIP